MPTTTQHADLINLKAELLYRGQTVELCLSTEPLSAAMSAADILASELPFSNGYARVPHTFGSGDGIYDSSTDELTMPTIEATFTASGGNLEWRSVFVTLGASIIVVATEDAPVTLLDGQNYRYQLAIKEKRI